MGHVFTCSKMIEALHRLRGKCDVAHSHHFIERRSGVRERSGGLHRIQDAHCQQHGQRGADGQQHRLSNGAEWKLGWRDSPARRFSEHHRDVCTVVANELRRYRDGQSDQRDGHHRHVWKGIQTLHRQLAGPCSNSIRAVHITELRERINALRTRFGVNRVPLSGADDDEPQRPTQYRAG
jgi:hypothetical protein